MSDEKPKKPSGHEYEKRRRARKEAERAQWAHRVAAGEAAPTFAPMPCDDWSNVHLLQLQRLYQAQELFLSNEQIPFPDRAKFLIATTHAIAKIDTKAQLERKLDEYRALVKRREDELIQAQAEALQEKHRLQQERAALVAAKGKS